jgi:hypothetical protein
MADDLSSDLQVSETPQDGYSLPTKDGVSANISVPYPALKDYFNVESVTDAQKAKFEVIWNHFSDEADSVGDLMYKLRQLENRLGSPAIGESRLTRLYSYVKISAQIKDSEKQRDSLLRK